MNDMTVGSPLKKIVLFAIPLLIGNIFQLFYNMADTFIVGKTIGVYALAGIGASGSIMFLILGFSQGFASGLSIPIAQAYGAKDYARVSRSVHINWLLAVSVSLVMTLVSSLLLRPMLEFMGTPSEIIDYTTSYLRVILGFMSVTVLFNMLSNMIRALGDSRTPLYFLMIAGVTNIVLDYILIVYFKIGVMGAGIATIISQGLSVALCLVMIRRNFPLLRLNWRQLDLRKDEVLQHCKIAFPMAFQMSIIAIGAISVSMALNKIGAVAVASYAACQKIEQVALLVLMSFGVAMGTYVGQNYGAKQYDRIRQGVRQVTYLSMGVSVVSAIIFVVFGKYMIGFFVTGESVAEMIHYGGIFFLLNSPCYFILGLLFIYRYTLQGLGNSVVPTIAGIMELVMRVVAAFVLSDWIGFAGPAIASPLAWLGAAIPLGIAYHTKKHQLHTLDLK